MILRKLSSSAGGARRHRTTGKRRGPREVSHLSDRALLRDLAALVSQDRATTAALIAHLAEVDARKLYLPAAHPSMFSYCVHELHLSEDAAYKRIQAARTARQFPAIFAAVADGRLNLTGVLLLAPHLTSTNADELLRSATGKCKSEIEELLAQRFPRSELLPLVQALPAAALRPDEQLAPERVELHEPGDGQLAPERVEAPAPRSKVAALAPERFALQVTIGQSTYEKLQYAQALLGHQLAPGDLAAVVDRALEALIGQLEQRKFAATAREEEQRQERDVVPWLRRLGFSISEARRAAAECESIPDASLEERLRLALSCLRPPHRAEKGLVRPA